MISDTEKKLWKWQSCLLDHVRLMVRIPTMLAAPFILTAQQIEAIQVAVNNTNNSNIGKVWHKDMARIAAFDGSTGVEIFSTYGRSFGLSDGAGADSWAVYDEIAQGQSKLKARAAEAVAYMQLWMDLTGNTIGAFLRGTLKFNRREDQNIVFEVLFFLYYFWEYVLMVLASKIFMLVPADSRFYKCGFFVHTLVAASFIIPIGLIGLVLLPVYVVVGIDASTLPDRQHYVSLASGNDSYAVTIVKQTQEQKVGIRFGGNRSGDIVITNIRAGSIAEDTVLEIGDMVLSIDGQSTSGMTPRQAAATLVLLSGPIEIVASSVEGTVVEDDATV